MWALVRLLERGHFPTAPAFDGLSYGVDDLKSRTRVPWDDYVTMCNNLQRIVGNDDDLIDLVEAEYHQVLPELRALAGALIEPKVFTRFVLEVLDPLVWPAVHFECTDLGGNDMRLQMRVRPGAKPNPGVFVCTIGALRGFTRHLDLPPVKILRSELSGDYAMFEFRLPESRTLVHRARRLSRAVISRVTLNMVLGGSEPPDPLEARLDEVTVGWDLSRRQTDVLKELVQGHSNKEIAQTLDCAENTVELHVTQLFRKSKATSRGQLIARFWQEA